MLRLCCVCSVWLWAQEEEAAADGKEGEAAEAKAEDAGAAGEGAEAAGSSPTGPALPSEEEIEKAVKEVLTGGAGVGPGGD